jgi:hypothetical protein
LVIADQTSVKAYFDDKVLACHEVQNRHYVHSPGSIPTPQDSIQGHRLENDRRVIVDISE